MSYAPFVEGVPRATREAPYELLALPPESPLPPWPDDAYGEALLLVAHPDDEVLFAGGLMLRYPHWDWRIVCMTGNEERREQSRAALHALVDSGVSASLWNLKMEDRYEPGDQLRWFDAVRERVFYDPEVVFTHGARGEYGHHHHVWLNQIAHVLFTNVWDFLSPCHRVKQLAKTIVREVPTNYRKRSIFFEAYGDIAVGLERYAPYLVEQQMTGRPEYFTQGVVGL